MLLGPVGGLSITTEGGGYIQRRPVAFDVCCCAETLVSRRGHVTGSDFARGALCTSGVGVGVGRGALGHVGGVGGCTMHGWGCS